MPRPEAGRGGYLIASGPGIATGTATAGGDIIDLAPTLLARHGVSPPGHMTGQALAPLLVG